MRLVSAACEALDGTDLRILLKRVVFTPRGPLSRKRGAESKPKFLFCFTRTAANAH